MSREMDFENYNDEYDDLEKDYLKHMKTIRKLAREIISSNVEETINDTYIIDFDDKTEDIYDIITSHYKTAYRKKDPSIMYAVISAWKKRIEEMDHMINQYNVDHNKEYRKKKSTKSKPKRRIVKKKKGCGCK